MQGKIKYLVMLVFMCMICISNKNIVQGYTGSGTEGNPYVVTKETELREILTTKGGTAWKYIAINHNIIIRKTIIISKGKFRVYAKGEKRMLARSGNSTDAVNNGENPKFCMVMNRNANVVLGYGNGSRQILRLGGNKTEFTGREKSSGFLYIGKSATVTVDKHALLTNVKNNKSEDGGTAVFSLGTLIINGEISYCEGTDGGAVGVKNGSLVINSTANIHHCSSETEGGGVFGIVGCNIEMNGGMIHHCTAKEEGGGIFVGGNSKCVISKGTISNNSCGMTGGGIFSGNGANLTVGKSDGTGPVISYNKAGTVGGGIRCNGGLSRERGGISYFYGGQVSNNIAQRSVGGISCGAKGELYDSKIYMRNMQITDNVGKEKIGGVRLPASAAGMGSKEVYLTNCFIEGNSTEGNCGGLMVEGAVIVTNGTIIENHNEKNGGGIYIDGGMLQLNSCDIKNNVSGGNGDGVYVAGKFRMRDSAYVDENNEVYLKRGCYIYLVGKLSKASGLVAKINSEVNTNGTKLICVGYSGGTASGELYHSNGGKSEKYKCISMAKSQLLRPSEQVNGYENIWIIISEKYTIKYDKNTEDDVDNIPNEQYKYWNENVVLSTNKIMRNGYILEEKKHWNNRTDGGGNTYKPGSIYNENKNIILYGIWKKITIGKIDISTVDRYYVVGQKIILNQEELLKKVTTDDDLHTGVKYQLRVTKIEKADNETIVTGNDIVTENYMNTKEVNQYAITIETEDKESGVKAKANMYVYVLNTDLANGQVRFISYEFLNTLDSTSKWNKRLNDKLVSSLSKGSGIYKINISYEHVNQIKNNIRSNNYKISHAMNKNMVVKLGI